MIAYIYANFFGTRNGRLFSFFLPFSLWDSFAKKKCVKTMFMHTKILSSDVVARHWFHFLMIIHDTVLNLPQTKQAVTV